MSRAGAFCLPWFGTLTTFVNEKLRDEETAFYYDLWKNGQKNMVKSIGAYWALLADIVPADKPDAFISHLCNPEEFARPHSIPTLSADHPSYSRMGNYWCGGVWAPANYMVFKGSRSACQKGFCGLDRAITNCCYHRTCLRNPELSRAAENSLFNCSGYRRSHLPGWYDVPALLTMQCRHFASAIPRFSLHLPQSDSPLWSRWTA